MSTEDALTKFLEMSGISMNEYKHTVKPEGKRDEAKSKESE